MLAWLGEESDAERRVGILDASNTRLERRMLINKACLQAHIQPVFIECIYTQHELALPEHVREVRLTCPEYGELDNEAALLDFKRRIAFYAPHYVRCSAGTEDTALPYITVHDGGRRIVASHLFGYLPSRMLYYLMNVHCGSKRIFLFTLPSAEDDNTVELQKQAMIARQHLAHVGEATLSIEPNHLRSPRISILHDGETHRKCNPFSVWTETSHIGAVLEPIFQGHVLQSKPQLRELDQGIVEGLSDDEIKELLGEDEYLAHTLDPYNHRYPRAESYHDLAVRLENVMMELERDPADILIMAHISVLQCIYAYFVEIPSNQISSTRIPPSVLVELTTKAYGVIERRFEFDASTISLSEDGKIAESVTSENTAASIELSSLEEIFRPFAPIQ